MTTVKPFEDFEDIVVESDHVRLTLEWIGEGWDGDYDSANPKDVPLLRFSVGHKTLKDPFNEGDAKSESYCTALDGRRDRSQLVEEAKRILAEFESHHDSSWKKLAEQQSWAGWGSLATKFIDASKEVAT